MLEQFMQTEFFKRSDFQQNFSDEAANLEDWQLIAQNFQTGFLDKPSRPLRTIPKIIHQIWLGSELPSQYSAWCDSWKQFHPEWEYHLWGQKEILAFGLRNEKAFRESPSFGVKSDIARYEILNRLGGLYVDTDFECVASFNDICTQANLFGGVVFDFEPEVCNALLGSCPQHPVLESLITKLEEPVRTWDSMEIIRRTGPKFLTTELLLALRNQVHDIVLFPSRYFYPYPNFDVGKVALESVKTTYVGPYTLGIHYWETSWFRKTWISTLKKTLKGILRNKD